MATGELAVKKIKVFNRATGLDYMSDSSAVLFGVCGVVWGILDPHLGFFVSYNIKM